MPATLETLSFITGLICVWLTVRQNVWNFPIGLINVATFCVVFFQAHLYADAGLQIVYFILGIVGWYLWLYGGEDRTRLKVAKTKRAELISVCATGIILTLILWRVLHHFGGTATLVDAATTSISLCAQWLLTRKLLESWVFWIVADVIYVPLYVYKQLHLTAVLYTIFLGLAILGLYRWHKSWRMETEAA